MNRKDMEAALDHGGEETNLDNCSVVIIDPGELEALEIALKELLSATRWRKTDEELPEEHLEHRSIILDGCEGPLGTEDPFPGFYASGVFYDWRDSSIVKPARWLPIPEVRK